MASYPTVGSPRMTNYDAWKQIHSSSCCHPGGGIQWTGVLLVPCAFVRDGCECVIFSHLTCSCIKVYLSFSGKRNFSFSFCLHFHAKLTAVSSIISRRRFTLGSFHRIILQLRSPIDQSDINHLLKPRLSSIIDHFPSVLLSSSIDLLPTVLSTWSQLIQWHFNRAPSLVIASPLSRPSTNCSFLFHQNSTMFLIRSQQSWNQHISTTSVSWSVPIDQTPTPSSSCTAVLEYLPTPTAPWAVIYYALSTFPTLIHTWPVYILSHYHSNLFPTWPRLT